MTRLTQREGARPSLPIISTRTLKGAAAAGARPVATAAAAAPTAAPTIASIPSAVGERAQASEKDGREKDGREAVAVGAAPMAAAPAKDGAGKGEKGGALLRLGRFLKQEKA
jgi:hypothetical protein